MQGHVDSYYKKLYTRDNTGTRHPAHQNPITTREAVKGLPIGKSPGLDGISIEFFQTFLDDIIGDLLGLITEIFTTKALYRSLNTSTICLIPKGGELVYLTNFKPISILSSVYKIIAKILANRRCIFDNTFMVRSAMAWAIERDVLRHMLADPNRALDGFTLPDGRSTTNQINPSSTSVRKLPYHTTHWRPFRTRSKLNIFNLGKKRSIQDQRCCTPTFKNMALRKLYKEGHRFTYYTIPRPYHPVNGKEKHKRANRTLQQSLEKSWGIRNTGSSTQMELATARNLFAADTGGGHYPTKPGHPTQIGIAIRRHGHELGEQ
uniref:Reverse transcriptase domain-containing protein n=1 Tax=Physcomitrium patens TaxID=3218 RepID=A0A2K1J6T6_PHYPA|nr:hypothetical protein PHYPA_020349 [Physcomitrium patens]